MTHCPLGKCMFKAKCDNAAVCTSLARLYSSRNITEQKIIHKQKAVDDQQEFVGTYIGYNSANSTHLVEVNRTIFPCDNISNSYIAKGTRVPVTIYKDKAFLTHMPSS